MYFDSFVIEYIPQEILNKIKGKSITHNTFRIQDNESMNLLCVGFVALLSFGERENDLLDEIKHESMKSIRRHVNI